MRSALLAAALLVACKTNDVPPQPKPLALKGPIKVGSDAPGSLGTWETLSGRLFQICPGFETINPTRPAEKPNHGTCYATSQGVKLEFGADAEKLPGTETWAVWRLGIGGDLPCSTVYGAYRGLLELTFPPEDVTTIIDALSRNLPKSTFVWQGYEFDITEIRDKFGVVCGIGVKSPFHPGSTATAPAPGR